MNYQVLAELGINTTSHIRAVQDANALGFSEHQYRQVINELTGKDVDVDDTHARHTFLYLVDQIVKDDRCDIEQAMTKAREFVKKNKWAIAKGQTTSYYQRKSDVDAVGNPKQKKGAKKEKAIALWQKHKDENLTRKQWIELLMKEVSLTQAGASTYYHNLKTGKYA